MSWPEHTYNLPRFHAVISACKQLDSEGKQITNDAVRDVVGGGSLRDISPIVRSYLEHQDAIAQFDQLKPDFAHLLLAAADDAFKTMRGHLNKAIKQSQSTAEGVSANYLEREREQAEETARLNAELCSTRQQLSASVKATDVEHARAEALRGEIGSFRAACSRQATEINRLNELLANAERQCNELNTNHKAEQKRLNELQEREASRLMQIIDNNAVKSAIEIQKLNDQLISALADKARLSEALNTIKATKSLPERKSAMSFRRTLSTSKR